MARFTRTSVPRWSSTTTSENITCDGSRNLITIPANATSVIFSTSETAAIYIGVDATSTEGIIVQSAAGDLSYVYLELAADAVLYEEGTNTHVLNVVWMYD